MTVLAMHQSKPSLRQQARIERLLDAIRDHPEVGHVRDIVHLPELGHWSVTDRLDALDQAVGLGLLCQSAQGEWIVTPTRREIAA